MKREVTKEELLRLARKAWPDSERVEVSVAGEQDRDPFVEIYIEHGGYRCVEIGMHALSQPALRAALLVLAGELDVTDMLESRLEADDLCAALKLVNDERDALKATLAELRRLWCEQEGCDAAILRIHEILGGP